MKKTVSLAPLMTQHSRAARLSGPAVLSTSATEASAAEPESGRSRIVPTLSAGRPSAVSSGAQTRCAASMRPVSRSSATAVSTAARYGAISTAVARPSFAPFTKAS